MVQLVVLGDVSAEEPAEGNGPLICPRRLTRALKAYTAVWRSGTPPFEVDVKPGDLSC